MPGDSLDHQLLTSHRQPAENLSKTRTADAYVRNEDTPQHPSPPRGCTAPQLMGRTSRLRAAPQMAVGVPPTGAATLGNSTVPVTNTKGQNGHDLSGKRSYSTAPDRLKDSSKTKANGTNREGDNSWEGKDHLAQKKQQAAAFNTIKVYI